MTGRDPDELGSLLRRLNDFVPEEQTVSTVPRETTVRDALAIMQANGFSQLPVLHNERLVGVFSYRSFAQRLLELDLGAGTDLLDQRVADLVDDLPVRPGA